MAKVQSKRRRKSFGWVQCTRRHIWVHRHLMPTTGPDEKFAFVFVCLVVATPRNSHLCHWPMSLLSLRTHKSCPARRQITKFSSAQQQQQQIQCMRTHSAHPNTEYAEESENSFIFSQLLNRLKCLYDIETHVVALYQLELYAVTSLFVSIPWL